MRDTIAEGVTGFCVTHRSAIFIPDPNVCEWFHYLISTGKTVSEPCQLGQIAFTWTDLNCEVCGDSADPYWMDRRTEDPADWVPYCSPVCRRQGQDEEQLSKDF